MPSAPTVVRCAVPSPLRRLLDYLPPADHHSAIEPGMRVRVALGRREVIAIVMAVGDSSDWPIERLKPITAVLDEQPLINKSQLALMCWVVNYYAHPPGEVLPLALSPRERRGEPPAPTGRRGLQLTTRGRGLPEGALRRAKRQSQLLGQLQQRPTAVEDLKTLGITSAVIRELLAKDLAEYCDLPPESDWQSRAPLPPGSEQAAAIATISASIGRFQCHLLQGITGSGKTEVYLQLIAEVLAAGKQALVLLPEIGLTPQMLERFRARFKAPIVELHSGLADGTRDRSWACARKGEAAIVIGTRSAVFVPLADPGIIIVDEEHDATFSQQDGLRYSARDVAVKRAQGCGCPVVLGSATPSLETLDNVARGRFERSLLQSRAGAAKPPTRELVDIRGLDLHAGLSQPVLEAVRKTLAAGEQALLFLNRRGFAPALTCHDCGHTVECQHCDARLTIHRHPARLLCHHCGAREPIPRRCSACGSSRLLAAGIGTEQTEAAIQSLFNDTPIHRVDSDSVRTRQDMEALRQRIAADGPAILIGTQMLAKGHDFPGVTLVAVLEADALLFSTDFRGEERLLQLLTQVAGRAGRGQRPGRVLIQTRQPEHALMQGLLADDYQQQAELLLASRYQRGLPPAGALALLRADSSATAPALAFLSEVMQRATPEGLAGCRLVGPLAAPMARRAGLLRHQLIVSGPDRQVVGRAIRHLVELAAAQKSPAQLRWFADVDPLDPI